MPSEPTGRAAALRDARQAAVEQPDLRGAALRDALCAAADTWLAEQLGDEPGVALVAVGAYGRRDPAPGSDLDLLLLHDGRDDVKAVADRIWYPVWDSGVALDHSVRMVGEAVSVARDDLKAALGLLDARHVAGDPQLTSALREAVLAQWRREHRRRLAELHAEVEERGRRHGELAFLLEPDLKESRGGLRDVHAMRAAAAAWVVDAPGERVLAAAEVLLDVRGELHRQTGRATDRLVLQEQQPVAQRLGYADADELMRAVYGAGRTIAFACDEAWRRVETALRPPRRWRQRRSERRPLADGVVEQDGEVVLARDADPAADPVLLLRVAAAAAEHDLPIALHTMDRLVRESAELPQPWPAAARDAFVALLGSGPSLVSVVEALDQAGLFERIVPEWERVRCKPQRNAVHRFTVDRHLVEAVVEAGNLTRRVSRPDLLLLGALLHDIGKGWPGDHTDAGVQVVPQLAGRWGLPEPDVATLVTMVREHLTLPDVATRRDLDDPSTVHAVAAAVADRGMLDLLHALTEADALATGPAAWGDWKARLVDDLVRRTAKVLEGEPAPTGSPLDDEQLALVTAGELAVDVTGDRVTIVAPDRPGLLWRWAGVLALHRLTVRSATAFSEGSMAVTVFGVSPRFGSPPSPDAVRADVRRAYDDALPIAARLAERERAYATDVHRAAPPRVLWVDDASAVSSVVEVRAHDSVGLLYRLTKVLADAGLDVRAARMSTLGAEVVDAFYVVDAAGRPVADDEIRAAISSALLEASRATE
ncbi:MAG: [protein-PII] uridylyltransferase [Frankiales bacterium]|nr:[protein-PII] uridylyltransferase [Frankiales bacterium]